MRPGPFTFGRASSAQLVTVHHDLQLVLLDAIEHYDFSITQGARTIEEQIRNIRKTVSKTLNSDHIPRDENGRYDPNAPAHAVDIVPYQEGVNPWPREGDAPDVREKKKARFYFMQGILLRSSAVVNVEIQQGVDWNMNNDFFDQSFDDLPHVALARELPPLIVEGELLLMANEALRSVGLPEWRNR